jgi:predicted regulator of Ras-like GTPase activity (Roadblock/LC7/MglB family)
MIIVTTTNRPRPDATGDERLQQQSARAESHLRDLMASMKGLRGALCATTDGRPVAAVLREHDVGSTAAIVASSRGLGERLADLSGEGTLQEIVVRSSAGYVVIYSVGHLGALTVLTESAVNLAMLHLNARDTAQLLAEELEL